MRVFIFALALPMLLGFRLQAQDTAVELNPVVAEVVRQLGDRSPDQPFVLLVDLSVKDGSADALIAAVKAATGPTRKEDANVRYQLLAYPDQPNRFQLSEQWNSVDGLSGHLQQPYLIELLVKFDQILAEPPGLVVLTPVSLE